MTEHTDHSGFDNAFDDSFVGFTFKVIDESEEKLEEEIIQKFKELLGLLKKYVRGYS